MSQAEVLEVLKRSKRKMFAGEIAEHTDTSVTSVYVSLRKLRRRRAILFDVVRNPVNHKPHYIYYVHDGDSN
jgi:transcription initiation factor IIE alpha subunit